MGCRTQHNQALSGTWETQPTITSLACNTVRCATWLTTHPLHQQPKVLKGSGNYCILSICLYNLFFWLWNWTRILLTASSSVVIWGNTTPSTLSSPVHFSRPHYLILNHWTPLVNWTLIDVQLQSITRLLTPLLCEAVRYTIENQFMFPKEENCHWRFGIDSGLRRLPGYIQIGLVCNAQLFLVITLSTHSRKS